MVCNNEDCCKLFALCLSDILFLKWCLSDIEHGSAAAREQASNAGSPPCLLWSAAGQGHQVRGILVLQKL
jgi:hypothetical protein